MLISAMVTNDLQSYKSWDDPLSIPPPKTNGWKLKNHGFRIGISFSRDLFSGAIAVSFPGDNPLGFPQFLQATKKQRDVGRSSARDAKQEAAVPA